LLENNTKKMSSSTKKASILYLDDEQGNLDIFRISFKREYNVFIASEPEEAFAILENNPIDVVITDQQMPTMKGTEFLQKTLEKYPDLIRIILTGYADVSVVVDAINKCGIYKYITKPYERDDLKMTIDKALETLRVKRENIWLLENLEKNLQELEQKYYQQLQETREYARRLEKQKAEIANINKKNRLSIHYASKIQQALLPKADKIKRFFSDFLEIDVPRDVVSGDFYWFAQTSENEAFLAVVDCTGHGVPGAFMSIIGHNELNKFIKERAYREPREILETIHQDLSKNLFADDTPDGMDAALCRFEKIDEENYKIAFSGAKRPLFVIQDNFLIEIAGSRKSIGGLQIYAEGKYEQHTLSLKKGDQVYIFSDGWADVANEAREKFGLKRLKELILRTHTFSAEEQKIAMMQELAEFKQDTPPRDDILLVSVRL
jgi:serine phosphatase RsbU (regulator of sigma subunit)